MRFVGGIVYVCVPEGGVASFVCHEMPRLCVCLFHSFFLPSFLGGNCRCLLAFYVYSERMCMCLRE